MMNNPFAAIPFLDHSGSMSIGDETTSKPTVLILFTDGEVPAGEYLGDAEREVRIDRSGSMVGEGEASLYTPQEFGELIAQVRGTLERDVEVADTHVAVVGDHDVGYHRARAIAELFGENSGVHTVHIDDRDTRIEGLFGRSDMIPPAMVIQHRALPAMPEIIDYRDPPEDRYDYRRHDTPKHRPRRR